MEDELKWALRMLQLLGRKRTILCSQGKRFTAWAIVVLGQSFFPAKQKIEILTPKMFFFLWIWSAPSGPSTAAKRLRLYSCLFRGIIFRFSMHAAWLRSISRRGSPWLHSHVYLSREEKENMIPISSFINVIYNVIKLWGLYRYYDIAMIH